MGHNEKVRLPEYARGLNWSDVYTVCRSGLRATGVDMKSRILVTDGTEIPKGFEGKILRCDPDAVLTATIHHLRLQLFMHSLMHRATHVIIDLQGSGDPDSRDRALVLAEELCQWFPDIAHRSSSATTHLS